MGDPSWSLLICKDLNAAARDTMRQRADLLSQILCCNFLLILRGFGHADLDLLSPLYAATRAQVT
jgi:hypothetical protein